MGIAWRQGITEPLARSRFVPTSSFEGRRKGEKENSVANDVVHELSTGCRSSDVDSSLHRVFGPGRSVGPRSREQRDVQARPRSMPPYNASGGRARRHGTVKPLVRSRYVPTSSCEGG